MELLCYSPIDSIFIVRDSVYEYIATERVKVSRVLRVNTLDADASDFTLESMDVAVRVSYGLE